MLLAILFGRNVLEQDKLIFSIVLSQLRMADFLAAGETRSFGAGNADVFLVKVDATGTVVWSKTIGDANHNDVARSVIPIETGGFIVSGFTVFSSDMAPSSVFLRLDQNGNTLWSRTYTTSVGNLLLSNYVDGDVIYASGGADGEAALCSAGPCHRQHIEC
jgi:outer membrane protein assembly factor BamB